MENLVAGEGTIAHFECRSCGEHQASPILSLGETPLANALLTAGQLDAPEEVYPLDVVLCSACGLVQLTETVPPEKLFREYAYFSSFSDAMVRHAEQLASRLIPERRLGGKSLVVEIASNDGYLLQHYQRAGVPVLGIEPALNIASAASARGIRTITEFFGEPLAAALSADGQRADVIHAHNVLAHVPDLTGFVCGLACLLKDEGIAVIEVPSVKDLVDRCEFDTIYHEHLSYFSLLALDRLFRRNGLTIVDVEHLSIHGGSLRLFASRSAAASASSPHPSVETRLDEERVWGADRMIPYRRFANDVSALKSALLALTSTLKRDGKRIAAYGAAAKGSTLLNYVGLGTDVLDFVVDRSTYKQGRYMPGVHLPICAPERMLEAQPDYVLLLTWNFADEILAQQAEYRRRGGRFIIPIPEVRVI